MLAPYADSIVYTHDAGLRLTKLRDLAGGTTNLTYNSVGLPQTITMPTSSPALQEALTYTASQQLSRSTFSASSVSSPIGVEYERDNLDRVTERESIDGDSIRKFTYDKNSQLTRFTDFGVSQEYICPDMEITNCYWQTVQTQGQQVSYSYDGVGNRTDSNATIQNGNRLVSFDGYALGYDDDGNLVSKTKSGQPQQLFEWNSLGQLTKVTVGTTVVTHRYDGLGRWAQRVSGSVTLNQIYDDQNLFMEEVGTSRLRQYTHYPGLDQPHSMRNWQGESGTTYYYGQDSPGHVLGLFNASKQMVNRYQYDPWGVSQFKSETKTNPLQFMGRYFDAHGGIYQVRARWYDPQVGRFMSEDPIGLDGGINLYGYAENNPMNVTDPTGLCPGETSW